MRSRILKSPRARIVAIAVGVGVIGSLATAPASFATAPAAGTACQTDGKISGRGSSFQKNALTNALIKGYTSDVCGPVGNASNLDSSYTGTDPAGTSMIAYNYSQGANGGVKNGSGAGITATGCRTDPFGGTDLPYNAAQIDNLNSAPGTGFTCPSFGTVTAPPYPPGSPWPRSTDTTPGSGIGIDDGVMNFPVAGGAVAIAVNLNGVCSPVPTGLNLTSSEFEKIMEGTINQWNDSALVGTNPILSTDHCSGPIQRIVRSDNSGTTAITDSTLNGISNATLCDGSAKATNSFGGWGTLSQGLTTSNVNTKWPTGPNCKDTNNNVAPPVYAAGNIDTGSGCTTGCNTGSPNLIALLNSNTTPSGDQARGAGGAGGGAGTCPGGTSSCGGEGGIGYAELGLWGTLIPGVSFVNIQNAAGTSFQSPGSVGAKSNCNVGAKGLPGNGTAPYAIGLGGPDGNWANDAGTGVNNPALQKENITYAGSGYPVCGLTFDFVYTGMSNESATGTPFDGMTNDQRRTLYSFFTYVFSPLAQSYLDSQTYDEVPGSWLPALRSGFQTNF